MNSSSNTVFELMPPLESACDLAANFGLKVFPCRARDEQVHGRIWNAKSPLTSRGFLDASSDLDLIERWWTEYPDALVGVPTGSASGLLVIDVDPAGADWYRDNADALACARVHTTRRGHHLVYRMPPAEVRNSASKIAHGVDVRGEGGYVIWWPAHRFEAVGDLEEIAEPPAWLLDLLANQHPARAGSSEDVPVGTATVSASTDAREDLHSVANGGRNDYLSREAFRLRKQGRTAEQIIETVGALNRVTCVPPLDDAEVRQIVAGKAIVTPAAAVSLDLRVTKNGVIADEENVLRILLGDRNLQGVIRFDEFTGEMLLQRPIDDSAAGERGVPRPWGDADTVCLQTHIQRHIIPRIGREKIEAVIGMYARRYCAVHPVRDYLQSLEWDRTARLNTWLRDYMGAIEQPAEYLAAVGARFLISAVARIITPGCQVDSAIVLEGAQGAGKSTALRVLAGDEYFSDSLPADLAHKDARDHLRGKWIIELSELAQFRRGEIETIKAFISRRHEQYRPSYGRHEVKFPRQCVFAGTTNADEYLVDTTGNRRFWAVACGAVQIDALARDRDQLWAEAAARHRAGEQWHLTGDVAEIAAAEAAARVSHDPWTADVNSIIESRLPPLTEVTPGEVMNLMDLGEADRHSRNAGRVAQILRDLGWRKGKRHMTRGQIYTRGMKL